MSRVKKLWKLDDVFREEGGRMMAKIIKLDHPHRKQRLTLVTTPRYATESYYKDWVYQPYAKDHKLFVCTIFLFPRTCLLGGCSSGVVSFLGTSTSRP